MQPDSPAPKRSFGANLLAAVLGGLIVLGAGAALIKTDVIDTGDTTVVERPAGITRPAAANPSEGEGGRTVQDIYRDEGRGVVFITSEGVSEDSALGQQQGTATGSGFLVDREGTIVTNAHVVEGASSVTVKFEEGGESVKAEVKGTDADSDLAVLKIDSGDVQGKPLPLGESDSLEVGDPVIAIGNPYGYTRTVTTGIVSALQRQIQAPTGFSIDNVIQTDASINPGNSGGPLLDADGNVIGINSQIATGGGQGSVGIGFAIPIDTAKKLLPQLKQGQEIQRAYLGVTMADVDAQLKSDLNLPTDKGALLQSVVEGGPADDAGLRAGGTETSDGIKAGGDLVISVDGKAVDSSDELANAVGSKQPGDKVELEYYRGGEKHSVTVTLAERPATLSDAQQGQQQQAPDQQGDEGQEQDDGTPFPLP
jgi:S1-C subfamily serine protease